MRLRVWHRFVFVVSVYETLLCWFLLLGLVMGLIVRFRIEIATSGDDWDASFGRRAILATRKHEMVVFTALHAPTVIWALSVLRCAFNWAMSEVRCFGLDSSNSITLCESKWSWWCPHLIFVFLQLALGTACILQQAVWFEHLKLWTGR